VIKETRVGSDGLKELFPVEKAGFVQYLGHDGVNHLFRITVLDAVLEVYSGEVFRVEEEGDE